MDGISGMVIRSMALGLRFDKLKTLDDVYREIKEQMLANIANSAYEWCLHHPPKEGEDRLFFVYEGGITGFDVLREIGGNRPREVIVPFSRLARGQPATLDASRETHFAERV